MGTKAVFPVNGYLAIGIHLLIMIVSHGREVSKMSQGRHPAEQRNYDGKTGHSCKKFR